MYRDKNRSRDNGVLHLYFVVNNGTAKEVREDAVDVTDHLNNWDVLKYRKNWWSLMNAIGTKFISDMQNIYNTAKKELKYNATRFLQLVSEKCGVQAAKELISKDGGTYGFQYYVNTDV
ncbi:hypothetical protein DEAC_c44750 [Desulfosporosinus acididurans]|uniref:Uncharacterized protein n=2 Tax=Desulfosporosinus acididurans TaxID=476652 RepID=A0A0J1FJM4_9FIRM|nr:hypothetical protein DEAC_c44750 [Desulfosporosinus acididurans]